jgi:hypothetical protein
MSETNGALAAAQRVAQELAAVATDPVLQAKHEAALTARWGGVQDIRTLKSMQVRLPQGADDTAAVTLERLIGLERRYAAPNLMTADYDEGVATVDEEIAFLPGAPALVTAEHATNPVRKDSGMREGADQGTAALAAAMAEDHLAAALIMTGRQLGNAGATPDHPIKLRALEELTPEHRGFLSIHSKFPGQAPSIFDTSEVHVYIGLGRYEPRENTLVAAERITAAAKGMGLRAVIANDVWHPIYKADTSWRAPGPMRKSLSEVALDKDGLPRMGQLAGKSAESTTSWLNHATDDTDRYDVPILQMEIANSLCITAVDRYVRDPKALAMGVHLGYLLTREATRIVGQVTA